MSKEFGSGISLEDFSVSTTTNTGYSNSINEKVLDSDVINKNLKYTFLRPTLVYDHNVKSKRNGLVDS